MMKFTLLLPLKLIPIGSTVMKPTGEKQYTTANELKVYLDASVPRPSKGESSQFFKSTISAPDDCVFLIPENGISYTLASTDKVMKLRMDEEDLLYWLRYREDERESR